MLFSELYKIVVNKVTFEGFTREIVPSPGSAPALGWPTAEVLFDHKACVIFVSSIDSAVNFRVKLEDVHCGSIEVIYCQVQQSYNK